jgi:hypothetical protein
VASKARLLTFIDEGSMQRRPLGGWPVEFVGIGPRFVCHLPFCGLPRLSSASAIGRRLFNLKTEVRILPRALNICFELGVSIVEPFAQRNRLGVSDADSQSSWEG